MLKIFQNMQASIFDIFRKHHITGDHGVPLGGIGYGIHTSFTVFLRAENNNAL